ncbi:hypothetical protein TELCIR_23972 [Teladorsagia circumcincta]|uniref:Uncharacterized protein n=1 Tax=Teladorsagia circumcincta TaxID=45464 RepID=A0A2G9T9V5_TELCI|nr:hypothetical protein TELCIR_23972 [Teladorsagia circumcincta]
MQIEVFNAAGGVVRTFTNTGTSLAATVFCRNGVWTARVSSTGTDQFIPITSVSCAQDGSTGADKGYVIGSAISK